VTYDRSAVFSRFVCDIWQVCSFLQICLWHMTGLQFSPADLSYVTDKSGENCRPVICHRQIWKKLQTCHMSQTNLEKTADLAVFSRFVCDIWQVCSFLQICLWHMTGLQFSPDLSVKYDRSCHMSQTNLEKTADLSYVTDKFKHNVVVTKQWKLNDAKLNTSTVYGIFIVS
jgi:hypothetical protein